LTIVVPSEEFEGQITEKLLDARNRVNLPGFRPGKVPMREVRRRFGSAVRSEVAGELMQQSFISAVGEEDMAPAGSPSLEVVKMDPGIDFEFTATFEVFPHVELGDLSKVELIKAEAEVAESDIDDTIERLIEQRKTWIEVERPAQDDDQVTVDFVGSIDDEQFDGGKGEDMAFVVGAGQMIEDFDRGVVDHRAGETVTFDATFPEDYQAENLKGQTAQFEVTIKKVEASEAPELNDEFFSSFGVEEGGGLEGFRAEIRANLERELESAQQNQLKQQVMNELDRLHTIQLPHAMVHNEIHVLKDQMMGQMQGMGGGQPAGFELPDDLFKPQAEKRVAVGLIINEVVTEKGLTADADKVRERIEKMAEPYAEPQQVINYYYGNPEQLQQIEMAVLEDEVVNHIVESAQVEVVQSSYADVIQGKHMPTEEIPEADAESTETAEQQAQDETADTVQADSTETTEDDADQR
jgi:trigger factor